MKKLVLLIGNHQYGNIFQTPEMYRLYLTFDNYEPLYFTTGNEDKLTGVLLAIIQKEHSGLLGYFSSRAIVIGGPLIQDNNPVHLRSILTQFSQSVDKKAIYSQFRNLWDSKDNQEIFKEFGYHYEPHLDIIIDVSDLNKLEHGISKNKKRNVIKSTHKGLKFEEIVNEPYLVESVDLILSTYKRIGLPCMPKEYFLTSFKHLMPNHLKVFGAILEGRLIGTRLELVFNDMVYDWYAGADDNESNKYPNDFLIYNILLWSNKNGFKKFDFGGAGKPDKPYGVRDHKLKFGGNLVEFGRFEKIHNYPLWYIGNLGLYFFKMIKKIKQS